MDKRHGRPWDRGSADAYYRRDKNPHYICHDLERIPEQKMTGHQIQEYLAGYNMQKASRNFKDYGHQY